MPTPPTILHRPHGLDGPYDSLFEERRPRDPAGGDMVAVGFLTRPGGATNAVRVSWTRNGKEQTPIQARAVATGHDEDRWLVELGTLEGGDEVAYRIAAEGEGGVAETPVYRFGVRRWRRLAEVEEGDPVADGLRIATRGDDGRPGPILTLTVPASATARLALGSPLANDLSAEAKTNGDPATDPGPGMSLWVASDGKVTLGSALGEHGPFTVRWLEEADGALAAVEITGPLGDDEALVGFGERFDALDQRGRAPDVAVYEQYKNQGNRTYLPVPFFLSNQGYGCLVDGTTHVGYDLGRTVPDRWRCLAGVAGGGGFALDFFAGTPAEIIGAFTAAVGRPALPPAWVFGPWMSSNQWNTQARVEAEVAQTQVHGIPATALVLEAWSDEATFYVWNGAEYAPTDGDAPLALEDFAFPADGPWPDPKGMVDALHAAGIRVLLWQIPALKRTEEPHPQHDADVAHALDRGYVLADDAGAPYRNPAFWFRDALIPDFTHPEATAWWLAKRRYLLDELGIDGFKTDGGEHLQGRGLRAFDGRRGDELVNAYPNLYVGAYHRFAQERRGGDAVTFSRAGHTGAGAFPAHWAGDENSTWDAFRASIVAGLSAGLSGVPFWGWDIAGFSDALPSAELYLRATAMAAFCPIMQYHSEYNPGGPSRDRTPWNVAHHTGDARVIPLARFFARLRMNLIPYILQEAKHCAATGEPLMRPLLFDDPTDPTTWRIQDQYRFGRDLLVAPVVEDGATERRLYLPAGTWRDLWTRECHDGGVWIAIPAPWERIPVFVRDGAAVPLNLGLSGDLGDDVGNVIDPGTAPAMWS